MERTPEEIVEAAISGAKDKLEKLAEGQKAEIRAAGERFCDWMDTHIKAAEEGLSEVIPKVMLDIMKNTAAKSRLALETDNKADLNPIEVECLAGAASVYLKTLI